MPHVCSWKPGSSSLMSSCRTCASCGHPPPICFTCAFMTASCRIWPRFGCFRWKQRSTRFASATPTLTIPTHARWRSTTSCYRSSHIPSRRRRQASASTSPSPKTIPPTRSGPCAWASPLPSSRSSCRIAWPRRGASTSTTATWPSRWSCRPRQPSPPPATLRTSALWPPAARCAERPRLTIRSSLRCSSPMRPSAAPSSSSTFGLRAPSRARPARPATSRWTLTVGASPSSTSLIWATSRWSITRLRPRCATRTASSGRWSRRFHWTSVASARRAAMRPWASPHARSSTPILTSWDATAFRAFPSTKHATEST